MVPETPAVTWFKSSHSTFNGDCVEVQALGEAVQVRDSKDPDGPRLSLTPAAWREFTDGIEGVTVR